MPALDSRKEQSGPLTPEGKAAAEPPAAEVLAYLARFGAASLTEIYNALQGRYPRSRIEDTLRVLTQQERVWQEEDWHFWGLDGQILIK